MSDAVIPGTRIGAKPSARAFLHRNPAVARLGLVALALVLWELAGHTVLDPNFLSPPSAIVAAMPRVLGDPGVSNALAASFLELVIAFVLAVAIGLAVGLAIGLSGFARRATLPLVLLLYSIPQVTILPLFVLYFGIGAGSKIAFGVSHGIFPIILNVVAGVQSVDAGAFDRGAFHGSKPPADDTPRRDPAHDAEPVHRAAPRDVRNAARRFAGGALCLDWRRRLLHPHLRGQFRSARNVYACRRTRAHGGATQRSRAHRRTPRLILAHASVESHCTNLVVNI